jgi:transcriptional regulator of NAD metabolism
MPEYAVIHESDAGDFEDELNRYAKRGYEVINITIDFGTYDDFGAVMVKQ